MAYVTIDIRCTSCGDTHVDVLWDKSAEFSSFHCDSCGKDGGERLWTAAPKFVFIDGVFSPELQAKREMRQMSKLEGYAKSGHEGAKRELMERRRRGGR